MPRRPSPHTQAVLRVFVEQPGRWLHGYDLATGLDIASGTLYPILMRLHDRGVLEARWEDSPLEGRPRRRMYRLTDEGNSWARSATTNPGAIGSPGPAPA